MGSQTGIFSTIIDQKAKRILKNLHIPHWKAEPENQLILIGRSEGLTVLSFAMFLILSSLHFFYSIPSLVFIFKTPGVEFWCDFLLWYPFLQAVLFNYHANVGNACIYITLHLNMSLLTSYTNSGLPLDSVSICMRVISVRDAVAQ